MNQLEREIETNVVDGFLINQSDYVSDLTPGWNLKVVIISEDQEDNEELLVTEEEMRSIHNAVRELKLSGINLQIGWMISTENYIYSIENILLDINKKFMAINLVIEGEKISEEDELNGY